MRTATDKQTAFIARLVNERYEDQDIRDLFAARCADPSFTTREASEMIDQLLATPRSEPTPAPAAPSAPVDGLDLSGLHGGYYAATIDGVTKFFRIDRVVGGKWDGWTFVKIQASDDLHRQGSQKPGQAYRGSSADYLAEIVKDERAALALYGHELGRCGVCSRTLTDELSRERGIGPVCWEKMGY